MLSEIDFILIKIFNFVMLVMLLSLTNNNNLTGRDYAKELGHSVSKADATIITKFKPGQVGQPFSKKCEMTIKEIKF